MQSCCFFFSRPFHENFKFLKNCPYDFHEILHSHSTPKGAPACAKASKSYGWDVRNIAKINPKMAKKLSFFDFFDFLTNCSYDSNESESEGKKLKPIPLPHMQLWLENGKCIFSRNFPPVNLGKRSNRLTDGLTKRRYREFEKTVRLNNEVFWHGYQQVFPISKFFYKRIKRQSYCYLVFSTLPHSISKEYELLSFTVSRCFK